MSVREDAVLELATLMRFVASQGQFYGETNDYAAGQWTQTSFEFKRAQVIDRIEAYAATHTPAPAPKSNGAVEAGVMTAGIGFMAMQYGTYAAVGGGAVWLVGAASSAPKAAKVGKVVCLVGGGAIALGFLASIAGVGMVVGK